MDAQKKVRTFSLVPSIGEEKKQRPVERRNISNSRLITVWQRARESKKGRTRKIIASEDLFSSRGGCRCFVVVVVVLVDELEGAAADGSFN